MRQPGPIALRAAQRAEKAIGVTERGDNRGPEVEEYLRRVNAAPGNPWCAGFVRTQLEKAAQELGKTLPADFPDTAWTPDYKAWAVKKGLWVPASAKQSQRGDLVCFYFPAKQRIAHIGIVIEPHTWGCWTVEGNTGPEVGEVVNRDGDGVYRKRRDWSEIGWFGGFVRLPW